MISDLKQEIWLTFYQRITISEIKRHPWFLKNLPVEFMDDGSGLLQNETVGNSVQQSGEEILAIVQEARTPGDDVQRMGGLLFGGSMDFDDMEADADIDDVGTSGDFVGAV